MNSMIVQVQPAPTTPLNLKFSVVYAPRVPTPPFVGYDAVEIGLNLWAIRGYDFDGAQTELFRGDTLETFRRFASHLRMDVAP